MNLNTHILVSKNIKVAYKTKGIWKMKIMKNMKNEKYATYERYEKYEEWKELTNTKFTDATVYPNILRKKYIKYINKQMYQ